MKLKDLVDNNTPYSTVRWAFCLVVRMDVILIPIIAIASLLLSFFDKTVDLTGIATILGIPTALLSTAKIFQDFTNNKRGQDDYQTQ